MLLVIMLIEDVQHGAGGVVFVCMMRRCPTNGNPSFAAQCALCTIHSQLLPHAQHADAQAHSSQITNLGKFTIQEQPSQELHRSQEQIRNMHKHNAQKSNNQSRNIEQNAQCILQCKLLYTAYSRQSTTPQFACIPDCHVHQMHRGAPNKLQCSPNANIWVGEPPICTNRHAPHVCGRKPQFTHIEYFTIFTMIAFVILSLKKIISLFPLLFHDTTNNGFPDYFSVSIRSGKLVGTYQISPHSFWMLTFENYSWRVGHLRDKKAGSPI